MTHPEYQHRVKLTRTNLLINGQRCDLIADAGLHHITGNRRPYFSVTGTLYEAGKRSDRATISGGCLHDEISTFLPELAPIVALQLAYDDGTPMYADANGWYWLAGFLKLGREQYHGGSGSGAKTAGKCFEILSKHLRVEYLRLFNDIAVMMADCFPLGAFAPQYLDLDKLQGNWTAYCEALRPQWTEQAKAGIKLLQSLAAKQAGAK